MISDVTRVWKWPEIVHPFDLFSIRITPLTSWACPVPPLGLKLGTLPEHGCNSTYHLGPFCGSTAGVHRRCTDIRHIFRRDKLRLRGCTAARVATRATS